MLKFADILEKARAGDTRRVAISGSPDAALQVALKQAQETGVAESVIFPEVRDAVAAVRSGDAHILMKGGIATAAFMKAIIDKENGLRAGELISHLAVIEVQEKMLLVTDSGICLNPSLPEKVEIIKNALPVARVLEFTHSRVAVLAAVEKVNPKMPETVEAAALSEMNIPGCVIQGPLAVDNAISPEAAKAKGIDGEVAGRANILLVPSVLAGNMFCKGIMYFSPCQFGGIVAGTTHPVCFLSRADSTETKLNTLALGVLMSRASG